ncbi:MAG: PD-(D/E)XK nuclease family protein [Defluviitaleaceae bacterium]|nr:PD-(D/E)XK nuclease family protein [Defluviitaleaceae bacterium]MCL2263631.1 PD-(D/E)XK nuclease family protein [Defluviitaleaceae bacterium]
MAVQFVLGKPGTGKTSFVLREIWERIEAGETAPLYYLVPEQFSLQSERLLLEGRGAATQVQVLSFNRLAYRLFAVLGGSPGQHADDLGKQMLLRKVLFEIADELEFYKRAAAHHGFVEELSQTITEMNHYCVSTEDLRERAALEKPAFAAKLRDTALILQRYRTAVSGRYLLTDEMPQLLCEKMDAFATGEPLPLLDGAVFWVDGFSGFTPQERQVLLHIMKRAAKVTFTITINDALSPAPRETMEKLELLVRNSRVELLPNITLEKNFRHENAAELAFFTANFGRADRVGEFAKSGESIEIIAANDRYSAVYAAAERVLFFVREKGYRLRDIAILCGDRSKYEKILQNVFDRLQISMFVDTETDILSHPLTEMIRAALDIPQKNWNYESVFRFLKTRLAGLSQETVDILENYALANGINSYRWRYKFADEQAEAGREQLLHALSAFEKIRADSKDTVKTHAKRVFNMLYALEVPQTLQNQFDEFMRNGDPAAARLAAQIWPKLCEVFDKLVEILGDEKITLKEFAVTLDAGLCQVGLGRIPPTVDQIVLGDITRSRYPKIKAMIVLGANDGALPPVSATGGLFTDYERKLLKNSALELAPDNFRRTSETNYNLYCALSQPSEKLVFIYAEAETSGKPLRVAPVITKIRKMFPSIKTTPAPIPQEQPAENSVFFAPVALSQTTAESLYGNTIYTAATRLESFARCPFAYFMGYILGAKPRKLYEVLPTDLGGLFHDVIAEFTKKAWSGAQEPPSSREEIAAIVDQYVNSMELENSIFHSTERNKHVLNKVRQVAAASCFALNEQIKRGEYRPLFVEHEVSASIDLANGKKLALRGIIDRVDGFSAATEEFIKITDYKTGSAKFNKDEALKGVQLQLMLYMNAVLQSRKTAAPGGVFYFPIDDPIINADEILPDSVREEAILKSFKPSGIEIGDGAKAMDLSAFNAFNREIEEKVKELGGRMTHGDIINKPYTKGQKCPCNYCKYTDVCNR